MSGTMVTSAPGEISRRARDRGASGRGVWVSFASYQVGWFALVLGVANGWYWSGVAVALAVIALHLWLSEDRRGELYLVVTVALLGFAVDSLLIAAGVIDAARQAVPAPLSPLWLVAMWGKFATILDTCLGWLHGRPQLAVILGAVGGPAAYAAGAKLGAIELASDPVLAWGGLGLAWAVSMPLVLHLAARRHRVEGEAR